eukprot:13701426-Ditylum_brightwellii.AAC.1
MAISVDMLMIQINGCYGTIIKGISIPDANVSNDGMWSIKIQAPTIAEALLGLKQILLFPLSQGITQDTSCADPPYANAFIVQIKMMNQ